MEFSPSLSGDKTGTCAHKMVPRIKRIAVVNTQLLFRTCCTNRNQETSVLSIFAKIYRAGSIDGLTLAWHSVQEKPWVQSSATQENNLG